MDEISRIALAAIGSFIAALTVAAFVGFIRKPRLVLVTPRTLLYSQLTDKGQMAEFAILNRGLRVEEDIRVEIDPACKTELVAASARDLTLVSNSLRLTRLPPAGEVKAVLLVEGKDLTKAEIVSFSSKDAQGRIVDRLEEVPATHGQRVALTISLGFLLALPFLVIQGAEFLVKVVREDTSASAKKRNPEAPVKVGNWSTTELQAETLKKRAKGASLIELGQITRKGDVVVIPFKVANPSDRPLDVSVRTSSPAGEERLRLQENKFIHGLLVFPGDAAERKVHAYLPPTFPRQRVGVDATLHFGETDYVMLHQIIEVK